MNVLERAKDFVGRLFGFEEYRSPRFELPKFIAGFLLWVFLGTAAQFGVLAALLAVAGA